MKRLLIVLSITILSPCLVSADETCIQCHNDNLKMSGYSSFTISAHDTAIQTGMPASCTDCHLGNPDANDKEHAHSGMVSVYAIKDRTWEGIRRHDMDLKSWPSLQPRGTDRSDALLPKISSNGTVRNNPDYKLIIWHDRNPGTLAFNPVIAEKTCGKCHEEIVKSFIKSPMGGGPKAHTQSQYVTWTGPSGPQSCGLWNGKLVQPDQASFNKENIDAYNRHSTMTLGEKAGYDNQRRCNQCHVGCLDCHYSPQKKNDKGPRSGAHTFVKIPDPISCYGGGKSFSCHAGPMERRRGDGYIRAEFTQSTNDGKKLLKDMPDVHFQKGINCIDCHEPNKKSALHGDLKRDVNCGKCHPSVVKSYKKGPHKNVDCASCHTTLIGGYAFNFWSAIGPKGKENPMTRIQDYVVGAVSPLIVKSPKGIWIPVHVVPHTSGNIKADEVMLSKRLIFRNSPEVRINRLYFSNDSYAITGLIKALDDKDHDTMVWLNIDRVAHATGKSRSCQSCHQSTAQKIETPYSDGSYKDVGEGRYLIVADGNGLRIEFPDIESMPDGLKPFKDKWKLTGDFAFPKIKQPGKYEKMERLYKSGDFVH